jgi:cbb3-type cytochrome oxidase maturation protein
METIFVLLPLALLIAAIAVGLFIWAARTGQFDDLDTPAVRILFDDDEPQPRTGRDSPAPVRRSVSRSQETSATEATSDPRSAVALAKAETRRVLR